jgi:hypothetical protein
MVIRSKIAALAAAALLAAPGCKSDPTELVVVVDTDYAVPSEMNRVRATISDSAGSQISQRDFELVAPAAPTSPGVVDVPFSFGVVPSDGDATRRIVIDLDGLATQGAQTIVSRRASTGFVKNQIRSLSMFLARSCAIGAMSCTQDQTCTENGCAASDVPPESLPSVSPGQEIPPHAPRDASPEDAIASDALDDAQAGGMDAIDMDGGPGMDAIAMDGPTSDAARGDATSADVDAGPMCPATCPSSCSQGECCSATCSGGVCPSCGAGCSCNWTCSGSRCVTTCSAATCFIDARPVDTSTTTCQNGANCAVQCPNDDICHLNCQGSSQCLCSGRCTMTCTGTRMTCVGNIQVCNRGCP